MKGKKEEISDLNLILISLAVFIVGFGIGSISFFNFENSDTRILGQPNGEKTTNWTDNILNIFGVVISILILLILGTIFLISKYREI